MSHDIPDSRPVAGAAVVLFFFIILLIGWDLLNDYTEGAGRSHLLIEVLVLCAAAAGRHCE